jgi:hypothetical protein
MSETEPRATELAQFARHVEDFRQTSWPTPDWMTNVPGSPKDLEDPQKCAGWCGAISDRFEDFMRDRGHEMTSGYGTPGHVYSVHQGHAVDWTARQFWPDASVPHVEPEADYVARHPWGKA